MWSVRLRSGVVALGHEAIVIDSATEDFPSADIAIINLGVDDFAQAEVVQRLKVAGCRVVAHAGHKERPLMMLGQDIGCDAVVSNSTLAHKLTDVLSPAP